MAKRKVKAKRSLAALPKGLPGRKRGLAADVNPFETVARQKRPKHEVHNRNVSKMNTKQSALAKSLERRRSQLKTSLSNSKKANSFVDRRIGEYTMTSEEQMLARIVRERSRRSKRTSKFSLDEDGGDEGGAPILTHKGRAIDDLTTRDHVMLSDDEDDDGDLAAVDTELHFGGGSFGKQNQNNPYGPGSDGADMAQVYSQRKTELDDLILRRKVLKAERMKAKEDQVETFETMDESFKELASMLQFRDKQKERSEREEAKRKGLLSEADKEMAEWDKEMKEYLFERKVKATDRTKTPEEKAKEEAERLHELETRRIARMNGDFEDDDFSDISEDEASGKKRRKKKKVGKKNGSKVRNPDELDDSEEEEEGDSLTARFTADGLKYFNKEGKMVKTPGDEDVEPEEEDSSESDSAEDDKESSDDSEIEDPDDKIDPQIILKVGNRVKGHYRIKEQYEGQGEWFDGVISQVNTADDGTITYDVTYDDGDFEEDMEPENVRLVKKTKEQKEIETEKEEAEGLLQRKRKKAKEKARLEIPFVFEVPTTLEALHDMIGNYASTGNEASLIIQRIHSSNSVRLNKNNLEKMQNFYDVLLRRFIAVGDAIHTSGDGGPELRRYRQLDALTKTLFAMSQDSPSCAGAVWGRRIGILQKAHAKRLRDAEFVVDEEDREVSPWPSTGTVLLLRALGQIFPVTDRRHHVVTPALLLLGQILAQTPVGSLDDLAMGLVCSGIMIEFTREAKRVAPEALAFLSGTVRLFSLKGDGGRSPIPSLDAAAQVDALSSLRSSVSATPVQGMVRLGLEKSAMKDSSAPVAILCSALHLIETTATALGGSLQSSEAEVFREITASLLCLKPNSKNSPLPKSIVAKAASAATAVSKACKLDEPRMPLQRRAGPSISEMAIKSLAPRMEDPTRYSMSKDKGKSSVQAALDRTRRELKREHKAVARELRIDGAFIETERRNEKTRKDTKARDKRHKNFAWLEGEQAAMNQQVAQGGGLLSGGGMGAARAKARSGKLGIKKGGKF